MEYYDRKCLLARACVFVNLQDSTCSYGQPSGRPTPTPVAPEAQLEKVLHKLALAL